MCNIKVPAIPIPQDFCDIAKDACEVIVTTKKWNSRDESL